ncbi:MAG: hypothetical protein EBY95_02680 [Actinobacteria bacterium]|nr:hypothetical protein [Actinomycetota bacterium]
MVVPARRRQAEQRLQQAMDMGGVEQVLAARHQGHALQRVVDRQVAIEASHGSVEGYVRAIGVTEASIASLRNTLLHDA